jgi:hypothetical protein
VRVTGGSSTNPTASGRDATSLIPTGFSRGQAISIGLQAALDAHVGACSRCAAFVASYRATPRILREASAAALPADVESSLKAFLRVRTGAFRSS